MKTYKILWTKTGPNVWTRVDKWSVYHAGPTDKEPGREWGTKHLAGPITEQQGYCLGYNPNQRYKSEGVAMDAVNQYFPIYARGTTGLGDLTWVTPQVWLALNAGPHQGKTNLARLRCYHALRTQHRASHQSAINAALNILAVS